VCSSDLPPVGALWALPVIASAAVMFVGLGLALSVTNIVVPDTARVVQVSAAYLVYISNVMFPLDRVPFLANAMRYNPFAVFIENARNCLLHGTFSDLTGFLWMSGAGVIIFLVGARLFYVMEWRVRGQTV